MLISVLELVYGQQYEYAQSYEGLTVDCSRVSGVLFMPNPRRCDQYFQCAYGFTYLVNCPSGLHFSASQGRCVYPKDANCEVSID